MKGIEPYESEYRGDGQQRTKPGCRAGGNDAAMQQGRNAGTHGGAQQHGKRSAVEELDDEESGQPGEASNREQALRYVADVPDEQLLLFPEGKSIRLGRAKRYAQRQCEQIDK